MLQYFFLELIEIAFVIILILVFGAVPYLLYRVFVKKESKGS